MQFFASGIYPAKWSESFIRPIFKSEDQHNPDNYRGIAINNSIGKVFNLILYNRLDKFLLDNDQLYIKPKLVSQREHALLIIFLF